MMKSLILLLLSASAVAGAVDVQKRVLNAADCPPTKGQHYVVLTSSGSSFCGGNLIGAEWVLTAQHCDESTFKVVLGRHTSETEVELDITDKDKHYFDFNGHRHDIMLLKLPKTVTLPVINLPDVTCTSPVSPFNNPYTIMGWSYTATDATGEKNQNKAHTLQCGNAPLHAPCTGRNKDLTTVGPAAHQYVKEHMLCSKSLLNCETCRGDSGGSLEKGGVLVGVTVAGTPKPGEISYFMDVCAYRDWIRTTTGI